MPSTKDIQRRIKSVKSTQKITRAMEMVAAAKMRKATDAVLKTRTYANLAWETVLHLSQTNGDDKKSLHPLLTKKSDVKKVCIILISSNRGMCGAYNSAILNKAHESIKMFGSSPEEIEHDFIIIGKKGVKAHKYFGYNIEAEFPKEDIISEVKEVLPITQMILSDYMEGKYDKVLVAYTDFVNAAKQVPRIKQLLPVDIEAEDEYLGVLGEDTRLKTDKDYIEEKKEKHLSKDKFSYDYTFEPNPREVLDEMIPRLIEVQLFQALLEANASEHSARMAAMHQANDSAKEMVGELTLSYNKARQAAITNEIAEIAAGAEALSE